MRAEPIHRSFRLFSLQDQIPHDWGAASFRGQQNSFEDYFPNRILFLQFISQPRVSSGFMKRSRATSPAAELHTH
jgi:hypothetical protein